MSNFSSNFSNFYSQEYIIMAEYNMLMNNHAPGIYVIPSKNSCKIWLGVIFVRHGIYKGGVFNFKLVLPDAFPSAEFPKFFFSPTLFHPHIDAKSGELLVNPLVCDADDYVTAADHAGGNAHAAPGCVTSSANNVARWRPGIDRVWQMFKTLRRLFIQPDLKLSSLIGAPLCNAIAPPHLAPSHHAPPPGSAAASAASRRTLSFSSPPPAASDWPDSSAAASASHEDAFFWANPDAIKLLRNNKEQFIARAAECVQRLHPRSKSVVEASQETAAPLEEDEYRIDFSGWDDDKFLETVRDKFINDPKWLDNQENDGVPTGLSWLNPNTLQIFSLE